MSSSSRSYGGGGGGARAQQQKKITQQEMKAFLENPDDPVNLEPFQAHLTPKTNVHMNEKMSGALLKVLDSHPDLIIKLLDFNPNQKTSKSRIINGARSIVFQLFPEFGNENILKKLIGELVKTSYQKQALTLLENMKSNIGHADLFDDAIKHRTITQKSLGLLDKAIKVVKGEMAPDEETVKFLKKIMKARYTPHKEEPTSSYYRQRRVKQHEDKFTGHYKESSPELIIEAVRYLQTMGDDTNLKRAPAQYLYHRLEEALEELPSRQRTKRLQKYDQSIMQHDERKKIEEDVRNFLLDSTNQRFIGKLAKFIPPNGDLTKLGTKIYEPLHTVLTEQPELIDIILTSLMDRSDKSKRYEIMQTMMHALIAFSHDEENIPYFQKVVPYVFKKLNQVTDTTNPVYRFLNTTLNQRNSDDLLQKALTPSLLKQIRDELTTIKQKAQRLKQSRRQAMRVGGGGADSLGGRA